MKTPITILACLALSLGVPKLGAQADVQFQLIVNSANPVTQLSKDKVSRLFLKKVTVWDNRTRVLLVDQAEDVPVRTAFSRRIHGRDVRTIKSYWQQMIFSGRAVPPAERKSDSETMEFVARNRNAIGYVSAEADLGADVKAVQLTR